MDMGTVASSLLVAAAGQVPAQAEGAQLGALLGAKLGALLGLEGRGPRPVAQLVTLSL